MAFFTLRSSNGQVQLIVSVLRSYAFQFQRIYIGTIMIVPHESLTHDVDSSHCLCERNRNLFVNATSWKRLLNSKYLYFFGPYQPHVILSFYVVAKLVEGDSSRKIVELIYGTSRSKPNNNCSGIERILKVHNMQKILAQIEEYREMVKIKASKLPKKHPRNRVV